MENALWRCADVDSERARRVADQFGMSPKRARWLCSRIPNDHEIVEHLNPLTLDYTNPLSFWDMERAVRLLSEAVSEGQKIAVVGDYDVDGVTSSAIVSLALSSMGAKWECFIPHRVRDGYGLSISLVERARDAGCGVIITVDNGIRANDAIEYANTCGMTVIITDHHEPGDELPTAAAAIVHYVRSDNPDRQKLLSGAGVAWKLTVALGEGLFGNELSTWMRGLAAIGALADVMPMQGENRRLVTEGIVSLRSISRPGWRALCDVAGVTGTSLTETDILWSITPRLNAAGRMDDASVAFELLMAGTPSDAQQRALALEKLNGVRKTETERAVLEACAEIERFKKTSQLPPVLVVKGEWPLGVVGIVAAKLVDLFDRPAIVFGDDGTDLLRGSGRSRQGVPMHSWVQACSAYLEHFGGHETALGCGVQRHGFHAFVSKLHEVAHTDEVGAAPGSVLADDYLPLSEATMENAKWLQNLGPYGNGFPAFQFYVGPVEVSEITPMGNGKHLRLTVKEGKTTAGLVWFQPPAWAFSITQGSFISCVASLEVNQWKGTERVQLRVITASVLSTPLTREDFASVYRVLRERRKLNTRDAASDLPAWDETRIRTIFDTFVDLGFAYRVQSAYHVVEQAQSCDLRESRVYQKHLKDASVPEITAG